MACEDRWPRGLQLLQEILGLHLEPDEVTYNSLLLAVRSLWRKQLLLLTLVSFRRFGGSSAWISKDFDGVSRFRHGETAENRLFQPGNDL